MASLDELEEDAAAETDASASSDTETTMDESATLEAAGAQPDSEDADSTVAAAEEDDIPDVLLTEAGNVLVDALLLKRRAFAVNTAEED